MSDLSNLTLALPPLDLGEAAASDKTRQEPWRWPTPALATYPDSCEQRSAEPCEIQGRNGKLMQARLMFFVPEQGVMHVQVPPARTTVTLRFEQFRTLTLATPLLPLRSGAGGGGEAEALLDERPRTSFRCVWREGGEMRGQTIGHHETDFGVFLFMPADDLGAVQRVFVPREACETIEIGPRIGDVLVEQKAATEAQVQQAAAAQQQLRTQKIGDILVAKQIVTPEHLIEAVEKQSKMPLVRIGEALLTMGYVTRKQLEEALAEQKRDRTLPLGQMMLKQGIITQQDLQTALARKMGYPLVDTLQFPVEADAIRKLPYAMAKRLRAMPLMLRDGTLIVALEDPSQRGAIDEIEFVTQTKVVPVLTLQAQLTELLREHYAKLGIDTSDPFGKATEPSVLEFDPADAKGLIETLERDSLERVNLDDERQIEQSDNSLVRMINTMIVEAHSEGVSDIHIEVQPGRERVKVRFRKDGVLRQYLELPHTYRSALIARIKIMCDLDISERRKPQDGKINFAKYSPQHKIELRVATLPTNNGLEDVVMRILSSARPIPLDALGLSSHNLKRLKEAIERPYGMVLCVGPTGSGKTTTLHSTLSHLNVPERKIWTAEDPVEITQPGLRQVQVNPKIDFTFAKALRAFLRADPDVVMVGEIRDKETAGMAIEASLTGHLVMSTLHTNSAPETVTRLLDMGMDPFNFADSLLAVLAQRLVRGLCKGCRVSFKASEAEFDELLDDYVHLLPDDVRATRRNTLRHEWLDQFGSDGRLRLYRSTGCEKCNQTGQRGRIGLHELLVVDRPLRRLVQIGARSEEIQQAALIQGMRTLRQDGIEKVLQGLTSLDAVRSISNL